MFAEDVGLLPGNMFTRMLERTRGDPEKFADYASRLFGAMATGGDVGFEPVAWFNGGLFDDDAATLRWDDIDRSAGAIRLRESETWVSSRALSRHGGLWRRPPAP